MSEHEDVRAIHHIRQTLETAENACDPDAIVALLADDVVLMVPDYPIQEGKAAAAAFTCGVLDFVRAELSRRIVYTSLEVTIMGDLALDRGTFSFSVSLRSAGAVAAAEIVTGKYCWLLRRADGGWKLWRVIVSRDEQASPAHDGGDG